MANKKISEMVQLEETPASADKVVLVDVDDTTTSGVDTGTTKYVEYNDLISEIAVADLAATAVVLEGEGIGSFSINVADPLKRQWERGIYMGVNSTYRGPLL